MELAGKIILGIVIFCVAFIVVAGILESANRKKKLKALAKKIGASIVTNPANLSALLSLPFRPMERCKEKNGRIENVLIGSSNGIEWALVDLSWNERMGGDGESSEASFGQTVLIYQGAKAPAFTLLGDDGYLKNNEKTIDKNGINQFVMESDAPVVDKLFDKETIDLLCQLPESTCVQSIGNAVAWYPSFEFVPIKEIEGFISKTSTVFQRFSR